MEIRKIKPQHIESIFALSCEQFKEESWTKEQFEESIVNDSYICAGIFEDEKPFCYVVAIQTLDDINILSIATKQEYKNQGLATRILTWYKNLAFGVEKTLSLEVKSKNENAKRLYKKLGFKQVHERKNYYKDGDSAIIMFCDL